MLEQTIHAIAPLNEPAMAAARERQAQLTKPQGRMVLVGVPRKGQNVNLHSLPLHFGKGFSGSHGGEAVPETDIPRYMNLYRHGRLRLRELITERHGLGQINLAIERMRKGEVKGRCLVDMSA